MSDSEEKPVEAPQPEKVEESNATAKIVRTNTGGFRTALVNNKGQFVKQPKKMADTREVTRALRDIGNRKLTANWDGTLTKSSRTLIEDTAYNLLRIASYKGNDSKMAQVAVAAWEAFMTRAHGKAAPGDAELGALERAGVKIVVLTAPDLPSEGELQPREQLKPNFTEVPFIEGELVEGKK